jgi:hypothetical protein
VLYSVFRPVRETRIPIFVMTRWHSVLEPVPHDVSGWANCHLSVRELRQDDKLGIRCDAVKMEGL